jgi:Lipocalin-like domain
MAGGGACSISCSFRDLQSGPRSKRLLLDKAAVATALAARPVYPRSADLIAQPNLAALVLSTGTPKRAAGTAYNDAELVDIYKGIIGAYAGTYSVEGNKVTHHIVASWFPEWIGGDQTRYAEIEGNRLTIKTVPLKSPRDGRDEVATLTFE